MPPAPELAPRGLRQKPPLRQRNFPLNSFNRQTVARLTECLRATSVSDIPVADRRSITTCSRLISNRARPICLPSNFGPSRARPDALHNQTSLQFRDCADDHDDCPTGRSFGIHRFALAEELNAEFVQFVQHLRRCFVDLASRSHAQTSSTSNLCRRASSMIIVQCWTACLRPAYPVIRVGRNNLQSTLDCEPPQTAEDCGTKATR